ncbi:quinol oxidase subunit 4 [Parapedobacter tibetensis]|uniref:quinol oxidase subunit 4 n=1 Tax=Parapedobacter tibetensis TaxID=2972951 RepID=UPI00214D9D1C|nr:quinol oxidase subunit 4 [Parapedobacter tibetensis]
MRKIMMMLILAMSVLWLGSCAVRTAGKSGKVPPGQAKKITGKKSAREHAPGQKKNKFLFYNHINER